MTDDRVEVLRRSWSYIIDWCAAHAPVTAAAIQGPADQAALAAAQERTGRAWPEQLLVWLGLHDGATSSSASLIPPGFEPLGVDQIVEYWEMLTGIWAEMGLDDELAAGEAQPAGSPAVGFLGSWLPVAANFGGDFLFVDDRLGDPRGCVGQYYRDDGFTRAPRWDDLAAMLESAAETLRVGRWFEPHRPDDDLVRVVEDGELRWTSGPAWEWQRDNPPLLTPDELRQEAWNRVYLHGAPDQSVIEALGLSAEQMADFRTQWAREDQERLDDEDDDDDGI